MLDGGFDPEVTLTCSYAMLPILKKLLPALALPLLTACQSNTDSMDEALPPPAVGSALYRVTFEASWSAATHANFPGGAHFSPIIGTAHGSDTQLFREGQLASLGMKRMAEWGNNTELRAEISALRGTGAALGILDGRGLNSPGTVSDTLRVDAQHPRMSVVTMIAPSPDWFVALKNENLLGANGQWVEQRDVPARAYDAGTDSGPTFTAPDQVTTPVAPISVLRLPPASGPAADGPALGVWHLERIR